MCVCVCVRAHARARRTCCSYLWHIYAHRQLIYNYPEQLFADAGVMAIEHADFEGIERLALVLGQCNHMK